jgi:hypothetical protein
MALKPIVLEKLNRITCLVIAPYGVGKTCLIRTILGQEHAGKDAEGRDVWEQVFEPTERVCVLSAESGLLSVRDLVAAGLVEGYEIGSFEDMRDAYQVLATDKEMQARYQWVFIDSLTEIAARCEESMKQKHQKGSDAFKMWGEYTDLMTAHIKGFRDLSYYSVVFSCLPTTEKDQDNKRFVAPAVAGKGLKEKLPSYFDEVFYMDVIADPSGGTYRALYTQPYNNYPAKDRSGRLLPVESPNLSTIKSKILGGQNG